MGFECEASSLDSFNNLGYRNRVENAIALINA